MENTPYLLHITKEEIRDYPLIRFEGNIHVVSEEAEVASAVEHLRQEPLLGFDTETRPVFRKGIFHPVALLQLSTDTDAYLFRLNHINLPSILADLLADPEILKLGVGLRDDIKALQDRHAFIPKGFVDLGLIAKALGIRNMGLRSLAGIFLKHRISKSAQVTNWENPELTEAQQIYAATDAWIGREIYCLLSEKGWLPEEIPALGEE